MSNISPRWSNSNYVMPVFCGAVSTPLYVDKGGLLRIMDDGFYVDPIALWGQDSSVCKSLDLQAKDCRFEPHCRRGVFLACLSFQIASVGSDHHTKKMEVPTCGLGSKSLHGCKRSTGPFSLRGAEFRRVKRKLSA